MKPDALFISALAQTMDFPTILGKLGDFSFYLNGDALYDQIIMVVKDGKLQYFDWHIPPLKYSAF